MSDRPTIKVLVVDDSSLFRAMLEKLIGQDPAFTLVGTAAEGEEAARLCRERKPDVITMDLQMPRSDGFAGIARIMAESPKPILVLSGDRSDQAAFRALSLGALDIFEKPDPAASLAAFGDRLRARLKLLASIRVIRHPRGVRFSAGKSGPLPLLTPTPGSLTVPVLPPEGAPLLTPAPGTLPPVPLAARPGGPRPELVVIGASLGGPKALCQLIRALPPAFIAPIALVQHIAEGFTTGLASWLAQETRRTVREATDKAALEAGQVLIAPSGHHLVVEEGRVRLDASPPLDGFRPAVSPLFTSAARAYGARAWGVILTGMGHDGADGMRALRAAGAATIAQDEGTSAVFGMPRAAIEAGVVDRVLPLDQIARLLAEVLAP
jgi:two-component system chemotaxis response regulator CheB